MHARSAAARLALPASASGLLLALATASAGQVILAELPGDPDGYYFGQVVAAAGDIDGDGHSDVLGIGALAPGPNPPLYLRVFSGADGALLSMPLPGVDVVTQGLRAAGAGDVDADGFDDLIVLAPAHDTAPGSGGTAWVLSGRDGLVLHELHAPSGHALRAVTGLGDVDRDGRDDFALGAPVLGAIAGTADDRVEVRSGPDASLLYAVGGVSTPAWDPILGTALAPAGDVDADGFQDLVVGASSFCEFFDYGLVRIVSGVDGSLLHDFVGDCGAGYGQSIGAAGDVNADGFGDILIGSRFGPAKDPTDGRVTVRSGADGSVLHEIDGAAGNQLGIAVAGSGDRDHDGRDDFIAGAPIDAPGIGFTRAWSGRTGTELFTLWAGTIFEDLGTSVADVGDVDADGYDDLAVGVPGAAPVLNSTGSIRVVSGYHAWSDIGFGLPGAGFTPVLSGTGRLQADQTVALSLTQGPPGASVTVVIGDSLVEALLKGGTLAPAADVVLSGLVLDAAGTATLTGRLPQDLPAPQVFYIQAWIVDASGPLGWIASNALAAATSS